MIRVYFVDGTDGIPEEELAELRKLLPEGEELRLIKNDGIRRDTVLGRAILRYGLHEIRGIAPEDTVIEREAGGKPYLRDHGDLHFSITHTENIAACAVSDHPVGLDAESADTRDHSRVARRMLCDSEREYVFGDGDTAIPERFCRIWTMKESFVKLTGEGMSRRFAEFDVLTGRNTDGAVFVPLMIGHTAACVCAAQPDEVILRGITVRDITDKLNDAGS